jgi:transposase
MRKPRRHKPLNDLNRSHTPLDVNRTLIAVVELSQRSWLVAGVMPGVEREPLKKLEPGETGLLNLLHRWRDEVEKAGHKITRIAVAFEAGRDGFWLARWLRTRGIEAHVIHASSVAVPREHRRAKTDRLDTELLKRAFLGWLRGERNHCKMVVIPTFAEEDAKRPSREHQSLVGEVGGIVNRVKATLTRLGIRGFNPKLKNAAERLQSLRTPEGEAIPANTLAELQRDLQRRGLVLEQIQQIEKARLECLKRAPKTSPNAMVLLLARVIGVGIETADMLVHEILSRNLRDRRAVARYGGPHRFTQCKRQQTTGERPLAVWQRSGAARDGPAGVALSALPKAQRLGAVVLRPHRQGARLAEENDPRLGTQAAHRALAPRPRRRRPRGRCPAPRAVKGDR